MNHLPQRPWWGPEENADPPSPVVTLRLFGFPNKRADVWVTLLLVGAIAMTRLLAFPASIWEQDEAYFSCAVLNFDVTVFHPHPPWFPLWIGLGKLAHTMVEDPSQALRIVSLAASVWVVFPLAALFALWLRRDLAVAAAVLYQFTPAVLFLGDRAFSGPLATAFFVCALALWLRADGNTRGAAAGSVVAGLCLLTRPHLFPSVAAVMVYRVVVSKSWSEKLLVIAPLTLTVMFGFGLVMFDAGGVQPLWQALGEHAKYHFGALADTHLAYSSSGLARAFLIPGAALAWIGLAILGLGGVVRLWNLYRGAVVVALLGLIPVVATVYGFSYAGNVRYVLPILALGSGFAVLGIAMLLKRLAIPTVAAICVFIFVAAWPALKEYRHVKSPSVRGVEATLKEAGRMGAVIVADDTLAAFFDYERARKVIPNTVLYASQIGTETVPPPVWATVAVYDAGHGQFVKDAELVESYTCQNWWLSRLSQGRYLDITVASGAEVCQD